MSKLNNNTTQLELLLQKVNALPEAGSGGIDTSDATATAGEIFAGETAYNADGKVTGTFTIDSELTEQNDLISQISTLVATKANPQGGTNTDDATATAGDILSGKTAYVKGSKVTGTIATKTSSNLTASGSTVTVPAGYYASNASKSVSTATQATPSITVAANGKISASATQTAGYVSAGTKTGTKQLTTQAAKTITPTTSNQTAVASGIYTTGAITVKGDSNLKAENIASGVSIFGVTGTHSGSENLDTELTEQENLISQLSSILDSKASGGSGSSVEWVDIRSLPTTYVVLPEPDEPTAPACYYEIPSADCIAVVFTGAVTPSNLLSGNIKISVKQVNGSFSDVMIGTGSLTVTDADGTGTILKIVNSYQYAYLYPIFAPSIS